MLHDIETLRRERWLTPNAVAALHYLRDNGRSDVRDIAKGIGRSETGTERALGALRGNRLVEQANRFEWRERATRMDGYEHLSTGTTPGCAGCGTEDVDPDDTDALDAANEPHFSWGSCDTCDTVCGGDRHPAHAVLEDGSIVHLNVCNECLYDINGLEFTPDALE